MKYFFSVWFLLIVSSFSFSQSMHSSSIAESEKKGGVNRILGDAGMFTLASSDFTTYYARCKWNINPAVYAISGSVMYNFTITKDAGQLVFDLDNSLVVDSVIMHQANLVFLQNTNKTLAIYFPQTLSAGQKDSLTIWYHGTPADNGFGSFTRIIHNNNGPVVWTLSEPYGARDWWPCRNGLDDKIDSIDIYITNPSIYAASANGLLMDSIVSNGNTTTHFKHRYAIATYLVGIAVTNYQTFTKQISLQKGMLPVTTTVYPESYGYFQQNITPVYNALQLYDRYFGPYPFMNERFGQTQFSWGGGMEHQSNAFVTSPDEYLMAHELGHQWFGDKVTTGSWQDIWLNEGFATYLADFFYSEHYHPENLATIASQSVSYATAEPHGSVWVDDTTSVNRIFNFNLTYKKGAMLLRMLRWTLGDSLFFKGIRQYIDDPALRYNFARTQDLQRNLEIASGRKLDYFFNQWFYGKGFPSFLVQWNWKKNKMQLQLTETTSDASVSLFKVPLQLRFANASAGKDIVINIQKNVTMLTVPLSFKPDTVLIDPIQYLVSTNNVSQQQTTLSLADEGNWLLYPNPAHNFLNLQLNYYDLAISQKVRIVNAAGAVVYRQTLVSISQGLISIPVSALAPGVYFIALQDEAGNLTKKKFIKQ